MLVNNYLQKLILLFFTMIVLGFQINAQVWTLQRCIDTAKTANKNLQMSKNAIELSRQRHKEATANLIPKLTAVADYKYFTDLPYQLIPMSMFNGPAGQFKATQFGVPHNISANVQLNMPLYNPQVYGAIKTTTIASELTELQYVKSEEQIFFDISNLYYNAQILQYQIAFVDSNLVNTRRLLTTIQLLKEQLLVKTTDVTKVQLQMEQLTTRKELIISKYEQVMNALKFSIGIPFNQKIEIEQNVEYKNGSEYTSAKNIDVQIAETQNRLLSSELSTLKFSRLPSLSLYGTYGKTGFGYNEKPNDFLKFYSIGFVGVLFSYPIFNGTITQRKINQKNIEIQNSKLQIEILSEQNTMLTENAKRQRTVAQRTVENTLQQIKLAKTIYENTVLQQKEGTATLTDILLADNALNEAQQTYINAVVDYLKADLELKKLSSIKN